MTDVRDQLKRARALLRQWVRRCDGGGKLQADTCALLSEKIPSATPPPSAPATTGSAPNGVTLIASERARQVSAEGWTPEHDDEHDDEQMAVAAACYAMPECIERDLLLRTSWPWDILWWKPTPDDRVRELVKAGALIAAEIDRLLRARGESVLPSSAPPGSAPRRGHTTRCQRHTTGRCTCGADEANAREGSAPATVRGRVRSLHRWSQFAAPGVVVATITMHVSEAGAEALARIGFDEPVEVVRPVGKERP